MKALLETLADMAYPKPRKFFSPTWQRSDYIALVILSLIIVVIIGFWPSR